MSNSVSISFNSNGIFPLIKFPFLSAKLFFRIVTEVPPTPVIIVSALLLISNVCNGKLTTFKIFLTSVISVIVFWLQRYKTNEKKPIAMINYFPIFFFKINKEFQFNILFIPTTLSKLLLLYFAVINVWHSDVIPFLNVLYLAQNDYEFQVLPYSCVYRFLHYLNLE